MGFLEGFFGKKEVPRRRDENAAVHEDFVVNTRLTADGAVEWEPPKTSEMGQIINDADRPRIIEERIEIPQANEAGIAWETPNVGAHLGVDQPEVVKPVKQAIQYDNGIDYAPVDKEILAEVRNERKDVSWNNNDSRSVGDVRAQEKNS
ncbi:MAG: hypothetical protein RL097_451 [Candidatus Parcubacteria bacterium]|jgi:hypothetical protein